MDRAVDRAVDRRDDWEIRYLGRPYPLTKVEFDDEEQFMLRKMSNKFGHSRNDIVRMAVREYFIWTMGGDSNE